MFRLIKSALQLFFVKNTFKVFFFVTEAVLCVTNSSCARLVKVFTVMALCEVGL